MDPIANSASPPAAETIAALATATGPAGIAIVRISGPDAQRVAAAVARLPVDFSWDAAAGRALHVRVAHPRSGERLDDAIMLCFRAPRSYTGEDVVELQGHGGSVPARRLLEAVLAAGARLAAPGEFTRRAFLNGRLDLTQAEAVLDLIQARTDRAAQAARAQLDGALGGEISSIYDRLTAVCADIEALLDFDEDEVPAGVVAAAAVRLEEIAARVRALLATWHTGHLLRDGALVVISGRPNVGKSSLLNALLGRPRAIVAATPGTTRDSIEESLALDGVPLRLVDTAGLRATACSIEAEGVARASALVAQADLNLHLLDAAETLGGDDLDQLRQLSPARTLLALNKSDLPARLDVAALAGWHIVSISARHGDGLPRLRALLAELLGLNAVAPMQADVSARHRQELEQADREIAAARELLPREAEGLVLVAERLRSAALALGRITGRTYSDDLLDAIFSRFCVGK
ncbi:MAG: tRNA uridine-5-carboxymethylaminomethyl(34) synthesis GTPase MnmE [Kiritimatiellae bacterium]|nr:tRNA uridine-5-carboxymethylaminomethyl(34) synthesis GTPase MnmE [Kiritimatiellia bacterium]